MNIAMLSIHSCPMGELGTRDTGGMSVYIRELAKALGERGHRIDIFTRYHGPKHAQVNRLSKNVRLIHIKAGVIRDMGKLAVYPYVKEYAEVIDDFRKKDGIVYTLIHSHYWLSGLVGEIAQQIWNIPHMLMFHTLGVIKNKIGVGEPEPGDRIRNEMELAQNCRKIVAPTDKEKKALIKHYNAVPEKISVIPCGVNNELFKPTDKKVAKENLGYGVMDNIILYVGRIDPIKGLDKVLQTVSQIKYHTKIKLVIVGGDDPEKPEMQQAKDLTRQLGVEDVVTFAGRVDQKDLPPYYNAADALVIASFYESFGLTALEALACGTPVVSTDVGELKSIIRQGKTGYVVSEGSIESMAESINAILLNSKFYQNRSASIRKSVLRFSWPKIADAVIKAYRDL